MLIDIDDRDTEAPLRSSCLVTRPGRPDKPARIRERLGETNESKIGVEIVVMKKLARRYQRDNYFLRRFSA